MISELKSFFLILIIILSIVLIAYSDHFQAKSEAQASQLVFKEKEKFVCEDFDEIVEIGKCNYNFVCDVRLRSGKRIKYEAPIERELIPCRK